MYSPEHNKYRTNNIDEQLLELFIIDVSIR